MFNIFSLVFKPLVGLFSDHQKEKSRKRQNKEMIETAKVNHTIKRIESGDEHAMKLDIVERQNAGWMDDFSFFLFLLPFIGAFIPSMNPHITAGFEALEAMPAWYQYSLGGMLIAVWGYRRLLMPIIQKILENKFK